MSRILFILFILFSVNIYAQNIGGPIVRGVEPKEPKVYGDPKLFDPFHNPDEVDEPYIEDPDMTRMELPFKEPEILFDRELQDEMLERYYEKEPIEPPMFEPDLRSKDSMAKEPEPLIVVPDERNIGKCPKGLRCN